MPLDTLDGQDVPPDVVPFPNNTRTKSVRFVPTWMLLYSAQGIEPPSDTHEPPLHEFVCQTPALLSTLPAKSRLAANAVVPVTVSTSADRARISERADASGSWTSRFPPVLSGCGSCDPGSRMIKSCPGFHRDSSHLGHAIVQWSGGSTFLHTGSRQDLVLRVGNPIRVEGVIALGVLLVGAAGRRFIGSSWVIVGP